MSEWGGIRKFVNLYLNNEDIRFLAGEQTGLTDGDEVAIIPAVAGG
jgi:molybdopterin converting factor small subunit